VHDVDRPAREPLRSVRPGSKRSLPALALGFAFAFVGVLTLLRWTVDASGIKAVVIQSDSLRPIPKLAESIRRDSANGVGIQILLLGDSMLMKGRQMRDSDTLPEQLRWKLARSASPGNRVKVYPFAFPGAGYSSFYFLADRLAATGADQVVIEFNPSALSQRWRTRWLRTDHVGWLGARNIPEALGLPLDRLGITTDRMLWTVACVEMGCAELWGRAQRGQLQVSELYAQYRKNPTGTSQAALPIAAELPRSRTAGEYRIVFGESFGRTDSDDVAIEQLAAAVKRFDRAGMNPLVYVTPINFEAMIKLGVWDRPGFARTLSHLSTAVVESGGQFADFHDLLPDTSFRDGAGHLTYKGRYSGQAILVSRFAPLLFEQLQQSKQNSR
jgi:hypothetical protein